MKKRKPPVKVSKSGRPRERTALEAYGHSLHGLAQAKERLETVQFQLETLLLSFQKHLGSKGVQQKLAEACIAGLAQSQEYWRCAVKRSSHIARKCLLAWLTEREGREHPERQSVA